MHNGLTYHYVAFIDILGFSDMVEKDCSGPSASAIFLPKLFEVHKKAFEYASKFSGAKVTQFSDSIILALPYSPDNFAEVVDHVALLQQGLLQDGILSRGGLSYGKHYSNQEFIFSDALLRAYKIERDRAIFPRVVVDDDLLDLLNTSTSNLQTALVREADGAYFIDYLRKMTPQEAKSAVLNATEKWQKTPVRVREKMRWLRDYAAYTFPDSDEFQSERFVST
ncbi:hypothetical protein [Methylotuvimicrobium sp. KM1]|uniref:hypothetical protein n=1 Tax=Methylotuvimicrobium sp. KM1 TaxID=3377707 RepID=UPI003850A5AA